jgi:hypothetical protein
MSGVPDTKFLVSFYPGSARGVLVCVGWPGQSVFWVETEARHVVKMPIVMSNCSYVHTSAIFCATCSRCLVIQFKMCVIFFISIQLLRKLGLEIRFKNAYQVLST